MLPVDQRQARHRDRRDHRSGPAEGRGLRRRTPGRRALRLARESVPAQAGDATQRHARRSPFPVPRGQRPEPGRAVSLRSRQVPGQPPHAPPRMAACGPHGQDPRLHLDHARRREGPWLPDPPARQRRQAAADDRQRPWRADRHARPLDVRHRDPVAGQPGIRGAARELPGIRRLRRSLRGQGLRPVGQRHPARHHRRHAVGDRQGPCRQGPHLHLRRQLRRLRGDDGAHAGAGSVSLRIRLRRSLRCRDPDEEERHGADRAGSRLPRLVRALGATRVSGSARRDLADQIART